MLILATSYPGGMFTFVSGVLAFAVTTLSIGVLACSLVAIALKKRKPAVALARWAFRMGSAGIILMVVSMIWIAVAEASPGNIESAVADWPDLLGMLAIASIELLVSRYFQRDRSITPCT